jgi:glycosyltransferase involved in cell wall biosynthesis
MGSPSASIIIRCYNEREHIGKLLHGVFQQDDDDFEVILVDSGSTDGTLEVARQFPIDDVVYIDPEEFSFGRALNYGCQAASGEFCVFASAHVYPRRSDWLARLLEKFEDDPELALVYGKQRGNEITKFPERQVFERWFPDDDIDHQRSPFCNNANAAIRRDLWEEFPYDEGLTGLEDLDWARRVREAGYEISYASRAGIVHVHDETHKEIYDRYRREAIALDEIIEERSFSFGDFLKTFVANTAFDYRKALRQGELVGNLIGIPVFRFLQFFGTYRGFQMDREIPASLWRRFYYPDANGLPEADEYPETGSTGEDDRLIDYSDVESSADAD